jgi:histone-lysine N-methyltransferase SETMAR
MFYMEVLKRLIDTVRCKRRELWRDHSLLLHHNVLTQSSLQALKFLAGKGISTMDYPPYYPDLAPADFWLFPEQNNVLNGKHFLD